MVKEITQEQINRTIIVVLEMQLEKEQADLQEAREEYDFRVNSQTGINGSLSFRLGTSFRNIELIEAALKYVKIMLDRSIEYVKID